MALDGDRLRKVQQQLRTQARRAAQRISGEETAVDESASTDGEGKEPAAVSDSAGAAHHFDLEPVVAIVVPAWNEERFLRPCLRSIREQYFNSWECIIVDDGSSDRTREIADEFVAKDSRFRAVSHTESLGLASARNTGIELTTAPYLTFLDADDFLYQHSLNARLKAIREADHETVAGSYCDWQPTREKEGRDEPKRPVADKPKVVGFPNGPECPFIATAPLVRRDVVEQLGGFNEALPTAEDFDLWIRILRAGHTFVYARRIGVAYRQKASGMVFTDTALHAKASNDIINHQYEDLSDDPNPPAFHKPLSTYSRELTTAKRLLRSYALSEAVADPADQEEIGAMLPDSLELLSRTGLDVRFELNAGLARAARAIPQLNDRETKLRTLDNLERKVYEKRPSAGTAAVGFSAGAQGSLFSSDRASKRSDAPIVSGGHVSEPSKKQRLGVLLVPMARYHAIEMMSLAAALDQRGIDSTFLVAEEFRDQFADLLGGTDWIEFDGEPSGLADFSGVYMMNDWGMTRELIREARIRNVPTFARVEGVQDYRDVDTGRIRLPYQTADHVFAQGANDVVALNHRQVTVVGNGRLEELFARAEREATSATGRVVINSNFTYGVFTELRNAFVEHSIRACHDAGLVPVISQHPADAGLPGSLVRYRSAESMSDLLHVSDVLISRFSTVPFEAMAIGTPFVYFRPQAERVATFDHPGGAYEIISTPSELAAGLERSAALLGSYRSVSEEFFRAQIDITTEPSDERVAGAIAEQIRAAVPTPGS